MKQQSKFLSLVLRHAPEKAGLTLDSQGWVAVDDLLAGCAKAGQKIDWATLEQIVVTSDKKRFTLSDDKTRIRAAQGHSVDIALGLSPADPPATLFRGTAQKSVAAIMNEGLKPGRRQQVHLSLDVSTATKVGMRHGKPVVLQVDARTMSQAGFAFFQADNGVWLTDRVPPQYLTVQP